MSWSRLAAWLLPVFLLGCQTAADQETIAKLRHMRIEIEEERLEAGFEKAIESYQRFLQETPDSALTPEAIRRLADLKVEKEYGLLTGEPALPTRSAGLPAPERPAPREAGPAGTAAAPREEAGSLPAGESETDFERRATRSQPVAGTDGLPEEADELERGGALEAVELYGKLLREYPLYERNDQVLYQMSRAYEELGRIEEAMAVMDRLVRDFPQSRYLDEVQFRRAEYFFTRRRYLDAEDAYASIVKIGVSSSFYQLALYKLGWTFYKQEIYEEALHRFIALLDHKVAMGYDFAQTEDEQERKRIEDTFRVISLGFSNLGGADSAVDYFSRYGKRPYEDGVYGNLGEFYFDKRRYSDAAATYNAFVSRNPFHRVSPQFHMRVIEIHMAGGFPTLVIEAKKEFARTYGLRADYWKYFEPAARPEVLGFLKTNLTDLATHYHALYQDIRQAKEKPANFNEALHWYGEFLASFPQEVESPAINYQMADLLLENRSFDRAAVEYEKTAYDYPRHEKSSAAGYAAIYAYREQLRTLPPAGQDPVRRETVRSSLKFAETFPEHEKAAIVLGAAADDLYAMHEYGEAAGAARKLVEQFPAAAADVLRAAWLVIGHASYELLRYGEAEAAYVKVLALLPPGDKARAALVDNLAASIYKQGEEANQVQDYRTAAEHFLRVGRMAPTSGIRVTAEYDAAAALIQLKDWKLAITVLTGFRDLFPGHELQPEVTKKIAYVYREDGQLSLAASEYERIERESRDEAVRREALTIAAELHEQAGSSDRALAVYRRYVNYFPRPVELNLETRNKVAGILKAREDREGYLNELRAMVAIEAAAGGERTPRTRYLAGTAALVLAEPRYEEFVAVALVKPFEANLRRKRDLMKAATQEFNRLVDYEVGEVTAAATFYLAEIYAHFSKALMASERPEGLSPLELEQYELAIEEQAYPFEETAIQVHEKNLELIPLGIYNVWIDRSLEKLAVFVPARYAKPEEPSGIVSSLDTFVFEIARPTTPAPEEPTILAEVEAAESESAAEAAPAEAGDVTAGDGKTGAQAVETPPSGEKPAQEPAEVATKEVGEEAAEDGKGEAGTAEPAPADEEMIRER